MGRYSHKYKLGLSPHWQKYHKEDYMADRFYERERYDRGYDEEERYGRNSDSWRYSRDPGYDREHYYRGYSSTYYEPGTRGYGYDPYSNEPYRSRYYGSNEPYDRSYYERGY